MDTNKGYSNDKDRSRGLKHIKNKRKYKDNTNKNSKYVPQKLQANLGSNWDRYDKEENIDEECIPIDTDYSVLADAPIAKGKHFQSKSDKLLASETEATLLTGLFNLNIEKLEESIITVPFYDRVNIDRKYFSDGQIEFMDREAEENLKKFNNSHTVKAHDNILNEFIEEKEKQESLDFQETKIEKKNFENISNKNEELEQWLDDFLSE